VHQINFFLVSGLQEKRKPTQVLDSVAFEQPSSNNHKWASRILWMISTWLAMKRWYFAARRFVMPFFMTGFLTRLAFFLCLQDRSKQLLKSTIWYFLDRSKNFFLWIIIIMWCIISWTIWESQPTSEGEAALTHLLPIQKHHACSIGEHVLIQLGLCAILSIYFLLSRWTCVKESNHNTKRFLK
jgi:hypothetical protein